MSPVLIILRPCPLNQFQKPPANITSNDMKFRKQCQGQKRLNMSSTNYLQYIHKKNMPYLIAMGSKTTHKSGYHMVIPTN